jgi:hypothetical protein
MNPEINSFIIKFENVLNKCRIFIPSGNIRPAVQPARSKKSKGEEIVYIGRGLDEKEIESFKDKELASDPLLIEKGGEFKFLIKIIASQPNPPIIEKYSFRFIGLTKSKNGIHSLRFDKDLSAPRGRSDWDDDMQDAPSHPVHHLHINFEEDNQMRLPTGFINPIMIISSIDYWYGQLLCE